jgi:hypothetical protein
VTGGAALVRGDSLSSPASDRPRTKPATPYRKRARRPLWSRAPAGETFGHHEYLFGTLVDGPQAPRHPKNVGINLRYSNGVS